MRNLPGILPFVLHSSFRGDASASNPESRDSGSGPSDHPGMTTLSPARRDAAIDREDHARGVGGTVGGKERHQVADLAWMRGAAVRKPFLEFLVAVFVAELVLGARLQQ